MNNNLIENRQIRVFISSTFQDMQDERDELMKKTFPVLRQKAAERDVTLTELDLRWGITPEESESGKVVEICLREIENSVPFFVGIIGNRYGWIPSAGDLGEGLTERYSQVKGYVERHLSVTEMEMQFGVLERKEDMHAFFYIKEQEGEAVDEPEKLAELKTKVRENGRYPVSTYSAVEDLAVQVEKAFTKLLDELYPEGTLSELEKERIGQRAYLNSLCQNYIRTESNFAAIEEWVSDWEKHQLVITGASGLGKSALVANWVKEKLAIGEGLPYRIIYHFVGNGGSLGSHGHVIKALCDEIRDRYGFDTEDKEAKTDEKALEELFNRVAAEGDKPLVIVLDAVNQIIDTEHSKRLNWLPIPPKKVKILFTTLENDETMEVFKDRHYPVFTLHPLTKKQRREMVRQYLSLYSKKLQASQVDRIVDDKQCKNTLVLKTLLDELVNFGIYEKLDEKIGTHLGASSVEAFYDILLEGYEEDFGEQFVKHILSLIAVSRNGLSEEEILAITHATPLHWSQFFCAIRQHLVVKNGLISFAHGYIRHAVDARYVQNQGDWKKTCQEEIISFFDNAKTHRAMDEVPFQYDMLGNIEGLHGYLVDPNVFEYLYKKERITLGGYWQVLKEIGFSVEEYLPLVDSLPKTKHTKILSDLGKFTRDTVVAPNLSVLFLERAAIHAKTAMSRASVFNNLGVTYIVSGDYKRALEYLKKALREWQQFDVKDYHSELGTTYDCLGVTYGELGDYKKALVFQEKSLNISLSLFGESHPKVATSYNNVGCTYGDLGDEKKALEYLEKALRIRLSLFGENHPDVALSFDNVGTTLGELGDNQKGLEYIEKSLQIRLSLFGNDHPDVANSYYNKGITYGKLGNFPKALGYLKKALQIRLSLFGNNHPDVAKSYDSVGAVYRELGDGRRALEYHGMALKVSSSLFGKKHPNTVSLYLNIGIDYGSLADHKKAFKYSQKALDIALQLFDENHPIMAHLYESVGVNYGNLGDFHNALEYELKALKISRSVLGENHPDTAQVYFDVGSTFGVLGDYQKAYEFCQKALKIQLVALGELHPDTALSFEKVADIHNALKDYNHEIACLQKALNIRLYLYGEVNPDVARLFNNIGAAEGKLGHVEKEIELRKKGLDIAIRIGDDKLIAVLYNRVGHAYKAAGQQITANDYFRQAAEKYRELGDEEQAQENLAMIEE